MTSIEYLRKNYSEETPAWLKSYSKGRPSPLAEFFKSRIVFYPGSGVDWDPLAVFGGSCSAHCFIYVDYLLSEEVVIGCLQGERGLEGYHILDKVRITEGELLHATPRRRHFLTSEEQRRAADGARSFRGDHAPAPYARLVILERDPGRSDGAERLAVLFLGADGHATFEAVFANGNAPDLFGFLLQEHGWGCNYDRWGRGGLCEKIMQRSNVFPRIILSGYEEWLYDGYKKINGLTATGSRIRDLYEKKASAGVCEILPTTSETMSSGGNARLKVSVVSFAYSIGMPDDAEDDLWDGFVFDCRALPDPYFEKGLSEYSGLDQPVIDFFKQHKEQVDRFLNAAESLVRQSLEAYLETGEDHLQVTFGCHGGHHRSVYLAERFAERLAGASGVEIEVRHTARQYWKA